MKILLHICCAPCAVYPFRKLRGEFEKVMGFWYNPNIHPFLEYQKRLEAVRILADKERIKIIYKNEYDIEKFLRRLIYRESQRCFFCYYERLEKTAIFAHRGKFDYFSSTLILSPHQDQDLLEATIDEIGKRYGIKPYLKRIEQGWQKSMRLSRKMKLYHQHYCGCIYSEEERYKKSFREEQNN